MVGKVLQHKEFAFVYRFVMIGVLNSIVFYSIYVFFLSVSVQYQLCSVLGYIGGIINSYFWNKSWTFKSRDPHSVKTIVVFIAIYLLSLVINLAALTALVSFFEMNKYIAEIFAIGASAVISYVGTRFFVFRSEK